jgi:hypothetical protein
MKLVALGSVINAADGAVPQAIDRSVSRETVHYMIRIDYYVSLFGVTAIANIQLVALVVNNMFKPKTGWHRVSHRALLVYRVVNACAGTLYSTAQR